MKKRDRYEREILNAYERGALVSARPTKAQLSAFRDAARATFIKSRRETFACLRLTLWTFKHVRMKKACHTKR
jgi:hypothetical protein